MDGSRQIFFIELIAAGNAIIIQVIANLLFFHKPNLRFRAIILIEIFQFAVSTIVTYVD